MMSNKILGGGEAINEEIGVRNLQMQDMYYINR